MFLGTDPSAIIIIISFFSRFSYHFYMGVFHSKSPKVFVVTKVSRTLVSILADLNNAVI